MKVSISVPDRIAREADRLARRLEISRSELYSQAVVRFLERQEDRAVTESLNRVYAEQPSALDPVMEALQRASVERSEW